MKYLITLPILGLTYYVVKLIFWAQLVASPYMVMTSYRNDCDTYNTYTFINKSIKADQDKMYMCDLYKNACEDYNKSIEQYDIGFKKYHRWFPL